MSALPLTSLMDRSQEVADGPVGGAHSLPAADFVARPKVDPLKCWSASIVAPVKLFAPDVYSG